LTAPPATLGPSSRRRCSVRDLRDDRHVSIGALFMGGFIPGAVMTIFMIAVRHLLRAQITTCGRDQIFNWKVLGADVHRRVAAVINAAIIMGGMTFGWFTPTEAAIAACAWAMILGVFLYRSLNFKQFYKVTMEPSRPRQASC